jgi:hypothetical protein
MIKMMLSSDTIKIGDEIPSVSKVAYQRALKEVQFLPGSIHLDDFTRSKGYKGALVSGLVLSCYMAEMLLKFFGPEWMKGGKMSLTFIKPGVQFDDSIVCRGVVTDKVAEKGGIRLILDVWMEKGQDTKVVIGTASGITPSV